MADDAAGAARAGVAGVLAVASAAIGRPLTAGVTLAGGSDRSLVLRCHEADNAAGRTAAAGRTVIAKSYPPGDEGTESFAAEAAGLAVAADTGLAPGLLGVDAGARVVVMTDLGDGITLADLLLGEVSGDAAGAVQSWARTCGTLAASTRHQHGDFAALAARYGAGDAGGPVRQLRSSIAAVAERAALLGVSAPAGLDADLADVATVTQAGLYPVFSPGDLCPDNNLVAAGGVRLLDFEAAAIYPVFLDAAYIRMPFSTCWCVFRLPGWLADAAEADYRELVCEAWPQLSDDRVWQPGLRRAIAAWSMNSMGWLLGRALRGDARLDPERTSPRTRQLMRHRWRVLAAALDGTGELPALAKLADRLLAATEQWDAPELPLYPVFRER